MKKVIFLVLSLMLMLLLISCNSSSPDNPSNPPDTSSGGTSNGGCPHSKIGVLEAVEATCTQEGLTEGSYCRGCGETMIEQEKIPKAPHTEVATERIEPTCTKVGYDGGLHCDVCGAVTKEPTEVPMAPHTEVANEYIAPTCTDIGYEGGTHCDECGKAMKAATAIAMIDHKEVANGYIAPTCTEQGVNGGTHCEMCKKEMTEGTYIPSLGHKEMTIPGYAATCQKKGLSNGKYCTVCKTMTVEQVVLEKTSHKLLITEETRPTCQSVGYTEKRECRTCGTIIAESVEIPKLDHIAVIDKEVKATCDSTGLTEGSHCLTCNEVIVAQKVVEKDKSNHVYESFATVSKSPSFSSSGSGSIVCSRCHATQSITFNKLVSSKLTKEDIYSIETDIYNAAYDNRWKLVDGNINTSNLWVSGDDWFGDKGDVLVITLKQEMALTDMKIYTAGNYTYGKIRVKDSAGNVTFEKTIIANGAAYGGAGQEHKLFSGSNKKAYTVEIEIGDIKGVGTFKVSEVEMHGASYDTRLSHTHDYREFIGTVKAATCQQKGAEAYECFCGLLKQIETEKSGHAYETLKSETAATCVQNGSKVYECDCGATNTVTIEAKGHVFHKLVECIAEPTASRAGRAIFKCNNCNLTEERELSPTPIADARYLRVYSIENGTVVLRLNVYGDMPSFEVRYSTDNITEENYSSAETIKAAIEGEGLVTITIKLDAGLDKGYYVAVLPYIGDNRGEISTVRVGGSGEIPISYEKAQVYHGEVLNSFRSLFDEDITTRLGVIFPDSGDTAELYGSNLAPIIDLEYMHYVTKVNLYYSEAGSSVTVRWSDSPLDFMSDNLLWDGYKEAISQQGWNEILVNAKARYIQIIFKDGYSPYEVEAYGYQCGEGDEISTEKPSTLPLLGDMIGMCGFVAGGGGHTPIEHVSAAGVLREYHNFGWSYLPSRYGAQSNVFTSTWMGNFDYEYRAYKEAGLNVIPCIQWNLGNEETISYKVDENNLPVYSNGELVRSTFWERFNPHTYFVFADNVFAFSARYGSNSSPYLFETMKKHCSDVPSVGQGTIEWIELGNEPDGSWNGIHNYLSAYQLAAATSAAYDGHCGTMVTPSTDGYHLGGKNADANIKLALAGVSGVSNEYITALCYWMKANRQDGKAAFDAFNVHHYMTKQIELPNGSTAYVGISPEEANLAGLLSDLIEIRDKYYPEKEVWITEFGWDTNQSYATTTSAHAYGEYTGRQVQAMWLTRAYLLLSAVGIDKADMYMAHDTGVEEISVGKYNTCGVIAFEYDENGEKVQVKKDSYYYIYTLKNTLGDYRFDSEIEAYDDNVMVYKYKTDDGKTAYALWCKTSDGTKVDNYQLAIDSDSATLVEAVYGDIDGSCKTVFADQYGYVSVNVSENPVYIVVE